MLWIYLSKTEQQHLFKGKYVVHQKAKRIMSGIDENGLKRQLRQRGVIFTGSLQLYPQALPPAANQSYPVIDDYLDQLIFIKLCME